YPIWVGGFWGAFAEVPPAALAPPPIPPGQTIVIQSTLQNAIIISDATPLPMQAPVPAPAPPGTGGIVLRSPSGAMIVVNDTGIYINNGKGASIDMMGPRVTVSGNPVATMASPHMITGCPFVPPGGNGPCVTAQWLVGAVRVTAGGM